MSCSIDSECSHLNTEFLRFVCKDGKCVEDPTFKHISQTIGSIEKSAKDNISQISPENQSFLSSQISDALVNLSQDKKIDDIKQIISNINSPDKKQMLKVFNDVTQSAQYTKEYTNDKADKKSNESMGVFSTALLTSPVLKNAVNDNAKAKLVGPEATKLAEEKFEIVPQKFVDAILMSKNAITPFMPLPLLDLTLSGFLSGNPHYITFIKTYIGDQGKQLVKDLPTVKKILYG